MITVQQLRRAKGIEGYYESALSEGASEYYASQRGVWYGKGAARIQLPGDFTEEEIRVFCKRTAQINELEETHRSELQKRTDAIVRAGAKRGVPIDYESTYQSELAKMSAELREAKRISRKPTSAVTTARHSASWLKATMWAWRRFPAFRRR